MRTRHHDLERWADFARGLLSAADEETLRRHLDEGCEPCARRLAAVRRLAALARAEAAATPPAGALRMVRSLAGLTPAATPSRVRDLRQVLMQRVFDSEATPLAEATRGHEPADRQLVYESAGHTVHLHVEPRAGGRGCDLTGQLLDSESRPLAGVPTCLFTEGSTPRYLVTSEIGEFDVEADLDRQAELRFLVAEDLRVTIELGIA